MATCSTDKTKATKKGAKKPATKGSKKAVPTKGKFTLQPGCKGGK